MFWTDIFTKSLSPPSSLKATPCTQLRIFSLKHAQKPRKIFIGYLLWYVQNWFRLIFPTFTFTEFSDGDAQNLAIVILLHCWRHVGLYLDNQIDISTDHYHMCWSATRSSNQLFITKFALKMLFRTIIKILDILVCWPHRRFLFGFV